MPWAPQHPGTQARQIPPPRPRHQRGRGLYARGRGCRRAPYSAPGAALLGCPRGSGCSGIRRGKPGAPGTLWRPVLRTHSSAGPSGGCVARRRRLKSASPLCAGRGVGGPLRMGDPSALATLPAPRSRPAGPELRSPVPALSGASSSPSGFATLWGWRGGWGGGSAQSSGSGGPRGHARDPGDCGSRAVWAVGPRRGARRRCLCAPRPRWTVLGLLTRTRRHPSPASPSAARAWGAAGPAGGDDRVPALPREHRPSIARAEAAAGRPPGRPRAGG